MATQATLQGASAFQETEPPSLFRPCRCTFPRWGKEGQAPDARKTFSSPSGVVRSLVRPAARQKRGGERCVHSRGFPDGFVASFRGMRKFSPLLVTPLLTRKLNRFIVCDSLNPGVWQCCRRADSARYKNWLAWTAPEIGVSSGQAGKAPGIVNTSRGISCKQTGRSPS